MVVDQTILDGHNDLVLHAAAELGRDKFGGVKVDGLVDGGHHAVFDQGLDDLGRSLFHAGGQLAHGDLVGNLDGQRGLLDDLQTQAAHLLLLLVALFVAEGGLLRALGFILVLAGDLLLAAGEILRALGDQLVDAVVKAVGVDGDGLRIDHAALTLTLLLLRLFGLCGGGIRLRGGCLRRSLGLGRFLFGCGRHGKDLLQRADLIVLGDIVKHHVELLVRQHLRVAARLLKIFSDDLGDVLRRLAEVRCDFLYSILH